MTNIVWDGKRPTLEQHVTVRGHVCRIIAIYALGTIDVQAIDNANLCWRVTGLSFS